MLKLLSVLPAEHVMKIHTQFCLNCQGCSSLHLSAFWQRFLKSTECQGSRNACLVKVEVKIVRVFMLQFRALVHGLLSHHTGAFQNWQHLICLLRSKSQTWKMATQEAQTVCALKREPTIKPACEFRGKEVQKLTSSSVFKITIPSGQGTLLGLANPRGYDVDVFCKICATSLESCCKCIWCKGLISFSQLTLRSKPCTKRKKQLSYLHELHIFSEHCFCWSRLMRQGHDILHIQQSFS